jgi:parallel beta-helix repeat protein/predicted outer membrane repeat protein
MFNLGSSPTLTNCAFTDNSSTEGGGIYNSSGVHTLVNCTFMGNSASEDGGALCTLALNRVILTNCALIDNQADGNGGGMYILENTGSLTNCTFNKNTAHGRGGGIYVLGGINPRVANCIFWGNIDSAGIGRTSQICGSPHVTYSDVQGGWSGAGNIDAEPTFVRGPLGFYYLSQTAAGQSMQSPCVDTGSDYAGNLGMDMYTTRTDIVSDVGIVDMGYHYPPRWWFGDMEPDGDVDFFDFAHWASYWMNRNCTEPAFCSGSDLHKDGKVDYMDLKVFAEHWLEEWQE